MKKTIIFSMGMYLLISNSYGLNPDDQEFLNVNINFSSKMNYELDSSSAQEEATDRLRKTMTSLVEKECSELKGSIALLEVSADCPLSQMDMYNLESLAYEGDYTFVTLGTRQCTATAFAMCKIVDASEPQIVEEKSDKVVAKASINSVIGDLINEVNQLDQKIMPMLSNEMKAETTQVESEKEQTINTTSIVFDSVYKKSDLTKIKEKSNLSVYRNGTLRVLEMMGAYTDDMYLTIHQIQLSNKNELTIDYTFNKKSKRQVVNLEANNRATLVLHAFEKSMNMVTHAEAHAHTLEFNFKVRMIEKSGETQVKIKKRSAQKDYKVYKKETAENVASLMFDRLF